MSGSNDGSLDDIFQDSFTGNNQPSIFLSNSSFRQVCLSQFIQCLIHFAIKGLPRKIANRSYHTNKFNKQLLASWFPGNDSTEWVYDFPNAEMESETESITFTKDATFYLESSILKVNFIRVPVLFTVSIEEAKISNVYTLAVCLPPNVFAVIICGISQCILLYFQ